MGIEINSFSFYNRLIKIFIEGNDEIRCSKLLGKEEDWKKIPLNESVHRLR